MAYAGGGELLRDANGKGAGVSFFDIAGEWGRLLGVRTFLPVLAQLAGASLDTLRTRLETPEAYVGRGGLLFRMLPLREGLFAKKNGRNERLIRNRKK